MKAYLLEHSCNEAGKMEHFHDVQCAYLDEKEAHDALFDIIEKTAKGENYAFRHTPVKRIPSTFTDRVTYEWKSEDGKTQYSHYYITEVELH